MVMLPTSIWSRIILESTDRTSEDEEDELESSQGFQVLKEEKCGLKIANRCPGDTKPVEPGGPGREREGGADWGNWGKTQRGGKHQHQSHVPGTGIVDLDQILRETTLVSHFLWSMLMSQVIGKLSSGEKCHVNYRDSKLTHILQNSLGMKFKLT